MKYHITLTDRITVSVLIWSCRLSIATDRQQNIFVSGDIITM